MYQGRLVHRRQKELQEREPEDIGEGDQFMSLYESLLGAVTQPEPGANSSAEGPEAQLSAKVDLLYYNTTQNLEGKLNMSQGRSKQDRGDNR